MGSGHSPLPSAAGRTAGRGRHGWTTYYGPEFISKDVDLWAYWNHVTLDFSRPGKPTDTAYIESFNGRFRQEYLKGPSSLGLEAAQNGLAYLKTR
jgi:transposase InsO family protein